MRNAAILVFANKQVRGWAHQRACMQRAKAAARFWTAAHHLTCPAPSQDMRGCLTPSEVCQHLGLPELRGRRWQVQGAVAVRGEGLYEGLDWLAQTLKTMK